MRTEPVRDSKGVQTGTRVIEADRLGRETFIDIFNDDLWGVGDQPVIQAVVDSLAASITARTASPQHANATGNALVSAPVLTRAQVLTIARSKGSKR